MAEEKGMEWKEMQLLLQGELQRMSERLSKDLRRELSSALSHWLEQPKHLAWRKKEEESNALSPRAKEASPQLPPQLPYSPTLSTSTPMAVSMNDERDIARMRMKARTYVSTEGIGGPVATGSMTLIGTPKSQTGRGFAFSRSASSAIDVGTLDEVDECEPENLKVVPDAPPDAGNKKDKRDSRAMSEPRSIFVHHISRYAPEEAGTAETPESPTSSSKSSFSRCNFLQQKCLWLVRLEAFDYIMGLAILANAILMGVQADLAVHSARTGELEPPAVRAVAVVLGVIFTVELVLRIFAFRLDFFTKPGWKWNIFDFTLVFLQISEEVVTAVVYTDSTSRTVNLSFMRILRVLRLVRIVRLVRVLRLIRELRTLVESIASTMTSLLWTVVLLLLLIFVVGICFTQVVADVATESPQLLQEGTDTFEFYGSLMRSVMSLYQSITSGVSWREASVPLERHSAVMGLVFAVYIAFAALAMLNVITGVFVESAMASAREENTVTVVSRMREIVHQMKIGDSGQMTWEQFEGQLDNPVMEAYFKSIDLSVTEARSLFLLLDIDDQGYIDVEEFIAGCCRIHGPAKAIDLTTLMCQVRKLHMELREHALWVVECMTMAGFASPASTFQGSPRHRRKPSFGLTAHPDHALEEKSPVASLDHKVHASPASSIEQAPEALSALTPMADGYTRTTGKMSMMIAQNGPGITNFVTPVKTAYWNHTPLLLVTPQAANKTIGQGGFQEVEQMAMFKDSVCYQEEVRDATRICEVLNRVIEKALHCSAPAQINIPRDFWTQVVEFPLPTGVKLERSAGGRASTKKAAELLSQAKFPVILNGAGVILANAVETSVKLAERLAAPVCCNYQHNDAFPGDHPLHVGPLGYNGSKAAMEMISKADVVLALGTRLNPFSTLPCYGIEYWPKDAKLIQVDINGDRIGLTKPVDVGIQGDAGLVAEELLEQLSAEAGSIGRAEREKLVKEKKTAWAQELESMDHELDDEGTTWNQRARAATPERMSPRQAWRAIMRVMPKDAIMSSDIGNNCAIGNAYPSFQSPRKYLSPGLFGPCGYGFPSILGAKVGNPSVPVVGFAGDGAFGISINEITACGRGDWPPVTMIVFRNFQWGAEKRNTTLWYDDNFVGTELNKGVEYAEMAKACGLKGVKVATVEELEQALKTAIDGQMQRKETTLVEVLLNQELGEPFRRDAMKAPVQIAKINASDMSE